MATACLMGLFIYKVPAILTLPDKGAKLYEPADNFFIQRSWPDQKIDFRSYEQAILGIKTATSKQSGTLPGFGGIWTLEGPGNIGGRINVILVHPTQPDTIFAGSATGGIFRTYDGGASWEPIFDTQPFLAIGCLAFEPGNPTTIYAGTGDPNISGFPFIGDGIWKSTDGGNAWSNIGLTDQRIISKIVIDPFNTNVIYAGTMGLPFERNNERGLYKSSDGGLTWNQVLFIDNESGIIDLVMNQDNSQILYAAGWNRIRNNEESVIIGQAAKIYKTTDGGATWNIMISDLPQSDMSRIGLTISKNNPDILYAVYVDTDLEFGGIYKTTDGGQNWNLQNSNGIDPFFMGGFGWYFGRMEVNPANDNEIYVCGIDIYKSADGGNNFTQADPNFDTHADKHDVFFLNSNEVLLATDGGIYKTNNGGASWIDFENIPNTQFYRVTSNPFIPGEYAGGTQDNGTVSGSASSINGWQRIFGGDGFTIIYDPLDPNIFYVETQNGDIWATSDGGTFIDYISGTIDFSDRRNWDMQYILSAHNSNVLYTGTYRIYKNNSGPVDNWNPISPDLTDGIIFTPRFHTISTVAESPLNEDYLFAGTSDGNVWRSLNGGGTWDNITGTLPDRYITSVKASPNDQNNLFVTVSGYKYNEFIPHVFKSQNNGTTWMDISGNLPQIAVNDIVIYPGNDSVFFVATDGGVYATINGGQYWERVGSNMPVIAVYDLEHDSQANKLIAGTHARSMMTYSVDSILLATGVPVIPGKPVSAIYPVPAVDVVYFETSIEGSGNLRIFDTKGRLIRDIIYSGISPFKVAITDFTPGVYFIRFKSGNQYFTGKFIKQ
ncbi:MAG: T9SS type A sorting domain-containing protein [Bacteroidota bacterium]|nr:T9SS type A sorting domain-containing protein [Bacteroidota bacterium]